MTERSFPMIWSQVEHLLVLLDSFGQVLSCKPEFVLIVGRCNCVWNKTDVVEPCALVFPTFRYLGSIYLHSIGHGMKPGYIVTSLYIHRVILGNPLKVLDESFYRNVHDVRTHEFALHEI